MDEGEINAQPHADLRDSLRVVRVPPWNLGEMVIHPSRNEMLSQLTSILNGL